MATLRAFVALFGLGLIGVLSLWPMLGPSIDLLRSTGQAPPIPEAVLRLLLLVQPSMLVALGSIAGLVAAHRVGLRSLIADRVMGRAGRGFGRVELAWGVVGGTLAGLIIIAGDLVLTAIADGTYDQLRVAPGARLPALISGMLYGGLAEEIMTRWGLMSLLAWGLHRLKLSLPVAIAAAGLLSALLFATGHLPALVAAVGAPSPALIARTILLNTAAGCIFALLYARRTLETAMLGHAFAHVLLFCGRLAGVAY